MEHPATHGPRRGLVRWLLRPLRPVARRVRWYLTANLTADLMAELAASRARQEAIQARQDYIVGMLDIVVGRLDGIDRAVRDRAREDGQAAVVAERLLLTLALEDGRAPGWPAAEVTTPGMAKPGVAG